MWAGLAVAVPVVFVLFGRIPDYLLCNIELTSRRNPVVVLADATLEGITHASLENLTTYMSGARDFAAVYRHMAGPDNSEERVRRELRNFQRWFVVRDYMRAKSLERAFFSDGDSVLFGNATQAWSDRSECGAVVNVEYQPGPLHMVAAGESSLWTIQALSSFCEYTISVYQSSAAVKVLQLKNLARPAVVDMTLLWLWWVTHQKNASDPDDSSSTTIPLQDPGGASSSQEADASRSKKNLLAFQYAKSLPLPPRTRAPLHLCNGLDVVKGTLFDHMHAWTNNPKRYALPEIDGHLPCTTADRGVNGGRPEIRNASSPDGTICFLNVHYQGNHKEQLVRDVCRLLRRTVPLHAIALPEVRRICSKAVS